MFQNVTNDIFLVAPSWLPIWKNRTKKDFRANTRKPCSVYGAEGRGRTGTVSLPRDFESSASANSATSARNVD